MLRQKREERMKMKKVGSIFAVLPRGINMGKLKLSKISYPVVHCENRSYISTLEAQGRISCGQYLDQTLGKFSPLYGPHL